MDKIDYITKNANLCTAKTEDSTKRKKILNQSNKIPSIFKRKVSLTKEQNKTPEKELNKMDTSNLQNAKFKTFVIGMLNNLSKN